MPEMPAPELSPQDTVLLLWGYFNAYWDFLEQLLYFAFYALTDDGSGVSRDIFYSQRSHAARRDMVACAAKIKLAKDPQTLEAMKAIIKRTKARADMRHQLAHGTWRQALSAEGFRLHRVPFSAPVLDLSGGYSEDDIRRAIVEMRDTVEAAARIIMPMYAKKIGQIPIPLKNPDDGERIRGAIAELMTSEFRLLPDTLPKRSR